MSGVRRDAWQFLEIIQKENVSRVKQFISKLFRCCCLSYQFRQENIHVPEITRPSQSALEANNQAKKPTNLCATCKFCQKSYTVFGNHKILLGWLSDKQTSHMFSQRDLRFVLCSRDHDVLRPQRIMGFLLGPKAPSLKMKTLFIFRLGVADFALWTLIGSRHLCCLLITC